MTIKLNSDRAVILAQQLFRRFGSWDAIRAAGVERPDGVIDLTGIPPETPTPAAGPQEAGLAARQPAEKPAKPNGTTP